MKYWRYRLSRPLRICAPELIGIVFTNRWITIYGGAISIEKGYAWDGCSPSFPLPGGIWIGAWDGPLCTDGRPVSWRASLVHDALCQFRGQIPNLCKEATVALFNRLLTVDGAPGWIVECYSTGISLFGPQDWSETQTLKGAT